MGEGKFLRRDDVTVKEFWSSWTGAGFREMKEDFWSFLGQILGQIICLFVHWI